MNYLIFFSHLKKNNLLPSDYFSFQNNPLQEEEEKELGTCPKIGSVFGIS